MARIPPSFTSWAAWATSGMPQVGHSACMRPCHPAVAQTGHVLPGHPCSGPQAAPSARPGGAHDRRCGRWGAGGGQAAVGSAGKLLPCLTAPSLGCNTARSAESACATSLPPHCRRRRLHFSLLPWLPHPPPAGCSVQAAEWGAWAADGAVGGGGDASSGEGVGRTAEPGDCHRPTRRAPAGD